jgi:hypothetical protein
MIAGLTQNISSMKNLKRSYWQEVVAAAKKWLASVNQKRSQRLTVLCERSRT